LDCGEEMGGWELLGLGAGWVGWLFHYFWWVVVYVFVLCGCVFLFV
jgi:hypothetical protein